MNLNSKSVFLQRGLSKCKYAHKLLRRFVRDERGSYLLLMTLVLPILVGIAGLSTEGGFWLYKQRALQSAADNAAYSAATAYAIDITSDLAAQAKAVTATNYNFVDGQNGTTVTLNKPPTGVCFSGTSSYVGDARGIEVIVDQSQARLFSKKWLAGTQDICARAVAIVRGGGDCFLALGKTGTGILGSGNSLTIDLNGCSVFSNSADANAISLQSSGHADLSVETMGAVGGISLGGHIANTSTPLTTGDPPVVDPYATAAAGWPSTPTGTVQSNTVSCPPCTLQPGSYSNGLTFNDNGTYTMSPGVYYVTGDIKFKKTNTRVEGTGGVTIVLEGTGNINATTNNSSLNITAPSTGPLAGVAIWEPSSSSGTLTLGKNSFTANIIGIIYAPNATVAYNGNSGTAASPLCLQIIAQQMSFGGNSMYVTGNCSSTPGFKKFGQLVALVE